MLQGLIVALASVHLLQSGASFRAPTSLISMPALLKGAASRFGFWFKVAVYGQAIEGGGLNNDW